MTWSNLRFSKSTILLFYSIFRATPEVYSKPYFVEICRNYGFLITKELIFDFQVLDLKDHFSALRIMLGEN